MINFSAILPELILIGGALVLLMVGAYTKKNATTIVTYGALIVLILAGAALALGGQKTVVTFNGAFVVDNFARFMKILTQLGAFAALLFTLDYMKREKLDSFELPILMLLSTAGMFALISARDLIALYMGLELMSLALYVLAAIHRDNLKATEAGLKYFVLGALSSGMLLYGSSLLYGFSGAVTFQGIALAAKSGVNIGMIFGLVFVLAGIAFKISAVPFHMWTPDVYEGSPTPITAFFAGAPKMAAMALFLRITLEAFPSALKDWQQIVVFIALASMFLGGVAAIGQSNIKRLMAYSSIANMGFALVGLAAGSMNGVQGVLVYMAIYLITIIGTFAFILMMRTEEGYVENIESLAGLSKSNPMMAFCFSVLLFSMVGIPWMAGFFAKFYVFAAAVQKGLWLLAIGGVVASVIGAYYYLRLIKIMYFDEPMVTFAKPPPELKWMLLGSTAFIFLFVFYPKILTVPAILAAQSFF